jgi:hypothetical protein
MQNDKLTKRQKGLIQELVSLFELFSLDYYDITSYEKDARTAYLELAKRKVVVAQVIIWYTLTDEFLNNKLCDYFFRTGRSYAYLWRTKRFQNFNHFILEELSLLQKLRFARAIMKIPATIVRDIERLNSLRNGLAHAFFPENLRKSKPEWKGKSIFTLEGVERLRQDIDKIMEFFMAKKALGR